MNFFGTVRTVLSKIPGYSVVRDRQFGRDPVNIETKSEDELLRGHKRLQFISTQRDGFRNTTFSPATALQLQINVVGTVGGKLTVIGADGKVDEESTKTFRHWAKHAEFTRGTSLNDLLRILIPQLTHTGGDFIAVLDRGELTHADSPSLRLKIFEPDQIRNVDDGVFFKLYPKNADGTQDFFQVDGIVVDKWDRTVSAFVGNRLTAGTFGKGEFIALKPLEVPGDFSKSNWIHVGVVDRPNQKRGISPLVHVANTLADIAAIQSSEVQATKLNSGLGLIIKDDSPSDIEGGISRGDDSVDEDEPVATPEVKAELDRLQAEAVSQASKAMREGQSAVVNLLSGKTVESFKNDRPNLNVVEMYDRMTDVCGSVLGLSPMFTRLKVQGSYSGARTEMVLVRPVFRMWQKVLERELLDWLAVRVLDAYGFNVNGLEDRLLWDWPTMDEVDQGAAQTALQKKFLNGEVNLIDIHGANTEAFLDRRAEEAKMCLDRGIVPPWEIMPSGAQIETPNAQKEDGVQK